MRNSWNNQSMRCVWAVIPLVVILGIIGIPESFAQELGMCAPLVYEEIIKDAGAIFTGTVISKEPLMEPYYHNVQFEIDELILGEYKNFLNVTTSENRPFYSESLGGDPFHIGEKYFVVAELRNDNTLYADSSQCRSSYILPVSSESFGMELNNCGVNVHSQCHESCMTGSYVGTFSCYQTCYEENLDQCQSSSEPEILSQLPPLKQISKGILPENVTCKEGLKLIFKQNNSPACVKPSTAEKLIERGWTINKHSSESIILYSSKLNDDSTDGSSSAPGVVILNDQEITLSKIPKLGETAIISVTINLKPEFSDFSGSMSTQKIMLESGFSFVNIDASILTLTPTNLMSYSESLPVTLNIPTVFQFEITPTKVGNWMVHVDGGNYKQRHTFNFIVNEDETILGEKPQAPSGIGGTVSGEGDFIISKIEPNTDENEIVEIIPVDTVDFSKTIVDDGPLYHSVLAGVPVALYRSLEYPEFIKIGDEFDVTMKWTFTEYDEKGNIEHQSVPINSLTKEIFNETFLLIKIPENIEMITGVSDWEETVKVYHDTSYNFDSEITTYTKTIPLDYTDAMHEQTYRFKLAEPFFPPFDHMTFGGLGFLTKFIFHQDGELIPPQLDAASINALQSDITVERLGSVDPQYPDVPSSEVNWGRVYEIATKGMNTPSDPDESQTQDIRDFYVNVLKRNPTNDELLNTGVSQTWIDSFFEKFPELK